MTLNRKHHHTKTQIQRAGTQCWGLPADWVSPIWLALRSSLCILFNVCVEQREEESCGWGHKGGSTQSRFLALCSYIAPYYLTSPSFKVFFICNVSSVIWLWRRPQLSINRLFLWCRFQCGIWTKLCSSTCGDGNTLKQNYVFKDTNKTQLYHTSAKTVWNPIWRAMFSLTGVTGPGFSIAALYGTCKSCQRSHMVQR